MKLVFKFIPVGIAVGMLALATQAPADDAGVKSKAKSKTVKVAASTPSPATATKRTHDGATLYQIDCARCHAERYPTERTSAQWKTILLHMRTRAQIPGEDARAILKYLQDSK